MARRTILSRVLAALLLASALPGVLRAAGTPLTVERVASGLTLPLYITAAPGDNNRLFIVEQRSGTTGRIRILNLTTGMVNATPFLSITGVSTSDEQGLLGLAFHPNYQSNGYFYVNFTNSSGTTIIRRYTVSNDPDIADPASAYAILSVAQPFSNHNGGHLAFGPDGYLYIGLGDGGSANDPNNRAQSITNMLLGKMLRIDVDRDDFPADPNRNYGIPPDNPFVGVTGDDEIWAYGLRNPWRYTFDRLTGDLYIADVGQGAREEISFQPASSTGGENYGWRCMEGTRCTGLTGCTCNSPTLTNPIYDYDRNSGGCITGGYVYRGCRIWDLRGTYFFADYLSSRIWSFRYDGATLTDFRTRTTELDPPGTPTITSITSFGEDNNGELYIVERGGEIWRIIPNGPVVGDLNGDGQINNFDIDAFVLGLTDPAAYAAQYPTVNLNLIGDVNLDGAFNNFDIDPFVDLLLSPPCP